MELKFVTATSRSAVVELTESGKFYTEKPYEIYVDGSKYMDSDNTLRFKTGYVIQGFCRV